MTKNKIDLDRRLLPLAISVMRCNWLPCGVAVVLLLVSNVGEGYLHAPLAFALLRSLILSALLRITLTFVVTLPILEEKAGDRIVSSLKLLSLMEALDCLGEVDAQEQWLRESILRHCCYEQRKRKSAPEIFNEMR